MNSHTFQQHKNDIRKEKDRVRNNFQQEVSQHRTNGTKGNAANGSSDIEYTSTNPYEPPRRPSAFREVSGLTGHRLEQNDETATTFIAGGAQSAQRTQRDGAQSQSGTGSQNEAEAQSDGDTREDFTSVGNILNQSPSYHFSNNFFSEGVLQSQVSRDEAAEFRKFIDNERADEERKRQLAVADNDLMKTNTFNSSSKQFLDDSLAKVDTTKDPYNNPFENTRYNKVRRSVVNIDSSHRDKTRYPNANNYRISLPRNYQHVKEVSLVASEIPNTDRVVRDDPPDIKRSKNRRKIECGEILNVANNNFYWINEEDIDEDLSCLIYNAPLTPGNYTALDCNSCGFKTIQQEIEEKVSTVNHFQDNTETTMLVDIDTRTNIVTILSIESDLLEVDPIRTLAGTNIVTIIHPAHPFSTIAPNNPITILNATSVGGVPASQINGTHEIENIIDANSYEIRVNTIANFTATGGGGNVTAGLEKPIKLLFSNIDTIGSILGFPQQDSSQRLSQNITFINTSPTDLNGNPTVAGTVAAQITSPGHNLQPGDTILIQETDTIPDMNGIHTVTRIVTKDIFEVGVAVKVVNNQTLTESTRIGKIKLSLDTSLTNITRLKSQVFGNIQIGNAHGFALNDTVFIGNVVGGLLLDGNTINGIHTVGSLPSTTTFGIEQKIEYDGNFGNAFVFKTDSTELIPITGVIPQNNGVYEPYPVEPIFTGTDVPDYMIMRSFDVTQDINIDVDVDVDTILQCGNVVTGTFASQTFTTTCTCKKKVLNIWIRVGNPSSTNVTGDLEIYDDATNTLLGTVPDIDILNESAVGTNFSVSTTNTVYFDPGTVYRWELTVSGGTASFCGNNGNVYTGGSSNLVNHDYEFRVYVSADVQPVSYYSIVTGRFDLQTHVSSVTVQSLAQNYIRSTDSALRFIKDAIVASNGIYRYVVPHQLTAEENFYVRRQTKPYRTTLPIVSPSIIGIQTVDTKINDFQFDTIQAILTSTFNGSSLDGQLFTIETADEDATSIQNIYPQSNGYFAKSRNACDPSRQQCILCPQDYIYVRYSDLIDCGTTDNAVNQPFEGCYQVHQIFPDVSTLHDDIFDTANIVKPSTPGTDLTGVNLGQCARLDAFSGVAGQNGTFNLGTIFFAPVTTITAAAPQIWKLDLSTTLIAGWTGLTGASSVTKASMQLKYFILPTPYGTWGIWFYSGAIPLSPAMGTTFADAINLGGAAPANITINQIGARIDATLQYAVNAWSNPNSFYTSADPDLSNHPTYTFTAGDDGAPVGSASGGTFVNLSAISSIQDGAVGGTSTSPTADALCIRTDIPHLLDLGDAIYYTLYANNCPVSAANTLPLFPPYASEGGSFTDTITDAVRGLNDTIQYIVPDSTDSTVFKIYGAGVVSSSLGTAGVRNVQLYYHKICGSVFNDFDKFFPNSYCGMIESIEHNVTESSNIYLGQTTTTPDINGFVLADETIVIDNNFLGWNRTGSCITTGNVGQTFAGEFVFPLGGSSTEYQPTDITSQNDGVIIADNSFFGGEQVYFTNDTNINVGAPGELRDKIFTVAATNLTAQQFSLVDTSILSLSDLFGNVVNAIEMVTQTVPGIYNVTVPSGALYVDIELIGGGGGSGFAFINMNRAAGGKGGRIIARIPVEEGGEIEPGDILQYTVGGFGEYGGSGGVGSTYGLGGDSGVSANGRRGGGGGGYSSIANATKNTILAVAGGGGGGGGFSSSVGNPLGDNVRGGDGNGDDVASDGVSNTNGGKGGKGGDTSLLTPGAGGLGGTSGDTGDAGTGPVPITSGAGGNGGDSNGGAFFGQSGGGAGGGYYGGGGGGGNSVNLYCGGGGGGGSGYLVESATATNNSSPIVRDNNGALTGVAGSVNLLFTLNVVGFGAGHFAQIPSGEKSHGIITVNSATNATFISSQTTGFPSAPSSTTILLSDNVYGDDDILQIKDKITEAHSFPYPAPTPSTTYFETDLVVTDEDIDKGTGILQNNKVDIITTSDARFPGLNGLGWVLVSGAYEPITNIIRDSTGKIFPVITGLAVNDIVHIISDHPNVSQEINGTHTVRYIDLGNTVPQFFELSDVIITNAGDNNGNTVNSTAVYFRTTITGNTTDGCITINEISNSCPAIIRATEHGFPIGSNVNVVILATDTIPPIDYANAGVILNARVTSEDLVTLPKFDTNLSGNLVNLCNLNVVNQQNLFIQQQGYFSQERLSTNCGVPFFEVDTANNRTIVITETRRNLEKYLTLPIAFSSPASVGTTTVHVDLSGTSFSSIPISNGKNVTISGHMNATPIIDGDYKVFGVTATSFRIVEPGIIPSSVGGSGGFVTFAAPSTIPGHGLQTGEKIIFEDVKSIPDINATSGRIWEVEVLDSTRFAIPVVLQDQRFKVYDGGKLMSTYTEFVTNKCPGKWCSNRVNMYLPDHGMANGDLFFLYGAEQFGGLRTDDLNTIHGEKRQNILTTEEKQTRKFATVIIDANNFQFEARSFPSGRTTGGGYDLCISAHNHNSANVALGFKNYGFSASLQNVTCNGDLNAFINLDTEPYIWMTSEKLTNILDTDQTVRNKFAKIQLTEEAGKICYNSFITSPKIYDNPDKVIDEIDVQFYRRDGKPFDFLGREHSFSLEFVEYQDRLLGTNIQSTRMKEDRGPVSQQGFVESTISGFHPEQNLLSPAQAMTYRSGSN